MRTIMESFPNLRLLDKLGIKYKDDNDNYLHIVDIINNAFKWLAKNPK